MNLNLKHVFVLGAALAMLVIIAALVEGCTSAQPLTPADIERNNLALQEARAVATATATALNNQMVEDSSNQPLRTAVSAAWLVLPILALCVAGGLLAWRMVVNQRRQAELVYPNAAGLLPVSRQRLLSGGYDNMAAGAMAGYHASQIEAARRPLIDKLDYTITVKDSERPAAQPVEGLPQLATTVPTFAALLDNGTIHPNAPLLRGYDGEGRAIMGDVGDMLSMIVSGLSGSGKTNSTAVLLTQAYLAGAAFIVCDPHSEAEEDSLTSLIAPLASAFILPVASTDGEIIEALRYGRDVLTARLMGDKASTVQKARAALVGARPLLIIVDEANKVLARSTIGDEARDVLEEVFGEGRKGKVFGAALAQTWLASRTGDSSALRDTAASKYCHRQGRAAARLLLPTDIAPQCEHLSTGAAVMAGRDGSFTTVTMPLITPADIVRAAAMIIAGRPTSSTASPTAYVPATYRVLSEDSEVDSVAGDEVATNEQSTLDGLVQLVTSENEQFSVTGRQVAMVQQLMRQQASHSDIIATVFNIKARGGEAVQIATRKLRAVQAYIIGSR